MTPGQIGIHMVFIDFRFLMRELAQLSARARVDSAERNKRYKALNDEYKKSRARQYKQLQTMKRTRHK